MRYEPVVETRFEYKGFPCVVLMMTMCYRCGYVGIPKGHKYYGADYDVIPVDCHGGLTYANDFLYGQNDSDTYWIGFDCAHCRDGKDFESAKKLFANDENAMKYIIQQEKFEKEFFSTEDVVRTLDYCIENCKEIVDQLLEREVNLCS